MATVVGGTGTFMLAAHDTDYKLSKVEIGRPEPGPEDVAIELKFCGQCHSDLHTINGEWGSNKYPIGVGHELAGIVKSVGEKAGEKFKEGDKVAVGCMVMSCMECDLCNNGIEQHCSAGFCGTYGGKFPIGKGHDDCADGWTNGGYSTGVTVHQRFCFKVPLEMPLEIAGPLCCAGITLYAPLSRHVLGKQDLKVGIVGFGGLGMMGVKLAKSMGATVSIFSRSDSKKEEAEKMGADLVVYTDSEAMGKLGRTYDVIIDTVSQVHDIKSILSTLKPYVGTLVMIGGVPKPYEMSAFQLLAAGLRIEGSLIGGAALTQEMLDYCETHKCYPEIKVIHAKEAEAALRALDAGTGGAVRSVIDCSTIPEL